VLYKNKGKIAKEELQVIDPQSMLKFMMAKILKNAAKLTQLARSGKRYRDKSKGNSKSYSG